MVQQLNEFKVAAGNFQLEQQQRVAEANRNRIEKEKGGMFKRLMGRKRRNSNASTANDTSSHIAATPSCADLENSVASIPNTLTGEDVERV